MLTVTVSPGTNGLTGRKLAPWPSESASTRPSCSPEREPTTLTFPIFEAAVPRKVICVPGIPYWLPGTGNTLTPCPSWPESEDAGSVRLDGSGAPGDCGLSLPQADMPTPAIRQHNAAANTGSLSLIDARRAAEAFDRTRPGRG